MNQLALAGDMLANQKDYLENNITVPSIGYFCSFAPDEIIHAAGAHPVRLFPSYSDTIRADEHIQAYACSVVRNAFNTGLQGEYDSIRGIVFSHSCDSYQRLSDLWRLNLPDTFFTDLVFPVKQDSRAAVTYTRKILERFITTLEKETGRTVTDDSLKQSIELFNSIRTKMEALFQKASGSSDVSGSDLHRVTRASMMMKREDVPGFLDELSDSITGKDVDDRPRVLATGSVCESEEVIQLIEDAGGRVVYPDLCTGIRPFLGQIAEAGDPLQNLAEFYTSRRLCASKHTSLTSRWDDMEQDIENYRAQAVIFVTMKFCEPYQFDLPYMKDRLKQKGIHTLALEIESPVRNSDQLTTRIETFLEMLS